MNIESVEKARARQKRYFEKNREKAIEASKRWNKANSEKIREAARRFYEKKRQDKSYRELAAQKTREWAKNNPDKVLEQSARKRASKLKRIPKWLTKEDFDKIKSLYSEAQRVSVSTGIKHHVDHIIPLRGKTISGLHVPSNLRVITALENMEKSNKTLEL